MTNSLTKKNFPVTFELEEEMFSRLKDFQEKEKSESLSDIVRQALRSFEFEAFENMAPTVKQVSIRLPQELKDNLVRFSTEKRVSIGELLRLAINNLCLQKDNNQTTKAMIMATTTPKRSAARKPVMKKVTVKKAAAKTSTAKKPAVKKATVKKTTAKKTVAKKAVAKRPAAKKTAKKTTVKKKTAARKPAARKTVAKKTTAKKK